MHVGAINSIIIFSYHADILRPLHITLQRVGHTMTYVTVSVLPLPPWPPLITASRFVIKMYARARVNLTSSLHDFTLFSGGSGVCFRWSVITHIHTQTEHVVHKCLGFCNECILYPNSTEVMGNHVVLACLKESQSRRSTWSLEISSSTMATWLAGLSLFCTKSFDKLTANIQTIG